MTSENFAYWLQGYFELSKTTTLDESQVQTIKNHLSMVFIHDIDPKFPVEQQSALNQVHQQSAEDRLRQAFIQHQHGENPYRPGQKC
jgi:hypothetical protein